MRSQVRKGVRDYVLGDKNGNGAAEQEKTRDRCLRAPGGSRQVDGTMYDNNRECASGLGERMRSLMEQSTWQYHSVVGANETVTRPRASLHPYFRCTADPYNWMEGYHATESEYLETKKRERERGREQGGAMRRWGCRAVGDYACLTSYILVYGVAVAVVQGELKQKRIFFCGVGDPCWVRDLTVS